MRVVIAEDESLLREGLVMLLRGAGFEVVGVVATATELLRVVARQLPDVVVTDIRMPPGRTDDGLQAAIRIRAEHPGIAVVVLSQFVQRRYAVELIGDTPAGVGYLLKQRVAASNGSPPTCAGWRAGPPRWTRRWWRSCWRGSAGRTARSIG